MRLKGLRFGAKALAIWRQGAEHGWSPRRAVAAVLRRSNTASHPPCTPQAAGPSPGQPRRRGLTAIRRLRAGKEAPPPRRAHLPGAQRQAALGDRDLRGGFGLRGSNTQPSLGPAVGVRAPSAQPARGWRRADLGAAWGRRRRKSKRLQRPAPARPRPCGGRGFETPARPRPCGGRGLNRPLPRPGPSPPPAHRQAGAHERAFHVRRHVIRPLVIVAVHLALGGNTVQGVLMGRRWVGGARRFAGASRTRAARAARAAPKSPPSPRPERVPHPHVEVEQHVWAGVLIDREGRAGVHNEHVGQADLFGGGVSGVEG